MDVCLVHLHIAKDCVDRLKSAAEEILAQFFEAGMGGGGVEVNALVQQVNLN